MKRQLSRFTPFSIMVYLILSTFNLADSASQPPKGNGVHFCGVTEWQPDNRRYARSFAANLNVGEPRTVRLIYFLPSDRAPEQDIDTKLDTMIKNVQKFYADEMERHGFGRKTFTFETNADGNALVHHVGGQFTSSYYSGNLNIHDLSGKVISEIADRLNRSTNMYLVAVDSGWGGGGTGGGNPSGGSALITIERERFDTSTYLTLRELGYLTAHELGHAFGLSHDFRDPVNIMAYRSGVSPQLSRCNAEWLDAHRYFNPGQVDFDISPTIRMLPPLVSPPNGTRLRFEVTDADGLHQAQLIIPSTISDPSSGVKLRGCKTLSGESDTVEFIMTDLTPNTKEIWLAVIDIHGNWTWQNFPIDVASPLPAEVAVSIPTEHLAAAVRQALGLPPSDDITEQSMLELTRLKLNPGNIVNLAGLEHARNLVWLQLPHNQVGDISPLAGLRSLANLELGYNNISDIGPFAGLTRLTILNLPDNNISAVSPLAGLTRLKILDLARNNISDIKPIAGLTDLYSLRLSDNSISDISVVAGLTKLTELDLSDNNVSDISAVAGLTNLTQLSLGGNISDIAAVARLTKLTRLILWRNNISDISAVAGLTDLTDLGLESNSITDISPVSGLTNLTGLHLANNNISDILPLVENTGLGGGDRINVWRNPLSYASINTHIPAIQAKGVEVKFDNRTAATLLNISGVITKSDNVLTVEVRDSDGRVFEGVPVTFTVISGGGTLSVTNTTTDKKGRAESRLTLGKESNRVTASAVGVEQTVTFSDVAEDGVHISDPNLRAAIEKALGVKSGSPISPEEMATLTHFKARDWTEGASISLLIGLEFATNLTELRLGNNSITDISPLSGLTNLRTLGLGRNSVTDISPLSGLTNLRTLGLSNNGIEDVSTFVEVLSGLTNLTNLHLTGNHITDISFLSGLTGLTVLRLEYNRITDISPLSGLTDLTELRLSGNNITDISPLSGLTNLTNLELPSGIKDLPALLRILSRLPHLTSLGLSNSNIEDVSALIPVLSDLTDLRDLNLSSNRITDLSPLAELTNLTSLNLWGNNISDISPLLENTGLGSGDWGWVGVRRNPLSYQSIHTHISTLQSRGVTVDFDNQAHPALLKISGDNQRRTPGETLANPFVVEAQDENGLVLAGISVTFTVTSGDGTLSIQSTTTNANGRAQSTLTLGPNLGTCTVQASAVEIEVSVTFNAEGSQTPNTLEIVSGVDQEGLPGDVLEKAFVVEVRDEFDKPLPGAQVTFTVTSGGGTLSETSVTTNSIGRAETTLTLGPNPGENTVTVSVTEIQEKQTFNAEGIRIPKTLEIISGKDQEGLPGDALEKPFVVEVRDQTDTPLAGVEVTFTVTTGSGTVQPEIATTDEIGRAESTLTLGPNPGTNTVEATVTGIEEKRTFTAEGNRIPKKLEIISGKAQEGLPGDALEKAFVVEVRDQTDNPLPGVEVTFTVTAGDGTLSEISVTTDSNGRAESILTLGPNPGTNTVTVSVTGSQETRTFNAEGTRIPKTLQIISGVDQEGLPGEALEKAFVVEVQDHD